MLNMDTNTGFGTMHCYIERKNHNIRTKLKAFSFHIWDVQKFAWVCNSRKLWFLAHLALP